jgi:small subunit ribosomal protein S9
MKVVNTSGKKKTAVARATFKKGKGRILINRRPLEIYQPELAKLKISEPLLLAQEFGSKLNEVDIFVNVRGGGWMGQAVAARTAIAKGIIEWTNDQKLKEFLLDFDRKMFVSDHRRKWSKHFGGRGARAKKQKSYR